MESVNVELPKLGFCGFLGLVGDCANKNVLQDHKYDISTFNRACRIDVDGI